MILPLNLESSSNIQANYNKKNQTCNKKFLRINIRRNSKLILINFLKACYLKLSRIV